MRRACTAMGILSGLLLALTACGGNSDAPPSQRAPAATDTPHNATLSPVLIHLHRDYETLSTTHATITQVWEGLAQGEQVQCGRYPDFPAPDGITAEDDDAFEPLAERLRQAAIDINRAVDLWKAECLNPRSTIPASAIDEGRLTVRAAGDSLREASDLLASLQPLAD